MSCMSNKDILDMLIVTDKINISNKDLRFEYDTLCKSDFSIEKMVKFGARIYNADILLDLILICYNIIYKLKDKEREIIYEEVYRLLVALRECKGNDINAVAKICYEFNNESIKSLNDFRNNLRRYKIFRIYYREGMVKTVIKGNEYNIKPSVRKIMNLYDKNMNLVEKNIVAITLKYDKLKLYKISDEKIFNLRKLVNNGDYDIIWIISGYNGI